MASSTGKMDKFKASPPRLTDSTSLKSLDCLNEILQYEKLINDIPISGLCGIRSRNGSAAKEHYHIRSFWVSTGLF